MVEQRFVLNTGTVSIATGASTVTGIGTTFSGRDLAGAQMRACPQAGIGTIGGVAATDAQAFRIGTIAEVTPAGVYNNLSLPLVTPYRGPALVGVNFELVYGPAIASAATQTAALERLYSKLLQNAGLVFNAADNLDYSLVPNNSFVLDDITRVVKAWRNGVLEAAKLIGDQWTPRGAWGNAAALTHTYALNDLVHHTSGAATAMFVSNHADNFNNAPVFTGLVPTPNTHWTPVPLPTVQEVLNALGIHAITVSTNFPAGGVDGDLWFKVQ